MKQKAYKIGTTQVSWCVIEIWFDPVMPSSREGVWDAEEQRIYVGPQVTKEGLEDTITHEVIHAIDTIYDIRLTERKVRELASGLVQSRQSLKLIKKIT